MAGSSLDFDVLIHGIEKFDQLDRKLRSLDRVINIDVGGGGGRGGAAPSTGTIPGSGAPAVSGPSPAAMAGAKHSMDFRGAFATARNAATDSFIDAMWGKVQGGSPIQRMGSVENRLRDAQKSGLLRSREDVAAIVNGPSPAAASFRGGGAAGGVGTGFPAPTGPSPAAVTGNAGTGAAASGPSPATTTGGTRRGGASYAHLRGMSLSELSNLPYDVPDDILSRAVERQNRANARVRKPGKPPRYPFAPPPIGGFGAPSAANPHVASTGIFMTALFSGWELSTAASSVRRGELEASLAPDPVSGLKAHLAGLQKATAGPMAGSVAEIGNLIGRVTPFESMEKTETSITKEIRRSELLAETRSSMLNTGRARALLGERPGSHAFNVLQAQHAAEAKQEQLQIEISGLSEQRNKTSRKSFPSNTTDAILMGTRLLQGRGFPDAQYVHDDATRSAIAGKIKSLEDEKVLVGELSVKKEKELNAARDKLIRAARTEGNVGATLLSGQRRSAELEMQGASHAAGISGLISQAMAADAAEGGKSLSYFNRVMKMATNFRSIAATQFARDEDSKQFRVQTGIMNLSRTDAHAASLDEIAEFERVGLRGAGYNVKEREDVKDRARALRLGLTQSRDYNIGLLRDNVSESALRAQGRFGAADIRGLGNSFMQAARAPGVDSEMRGLILQQGMNEVRGQMIGHMPYGGGEINPLSTSVENSFGPLQEKAVEAIQVLKEIASKLPPGVL